MDAHHEHRRSDAARPWWRRWSRGRRQPAQVRPLMWRLAVPVVCAGAGLLAATSSINAAGTDLRGGRNTDVIGLVSEQRSQVQQLRSQVRALQAGVDSLASQLGGAKTVQLQRQLHRLDAPAGVSALTGPGVTVTLDDAPLGESVPDGTDPNLLVVHQQDIQAVVNALWAGGASGVSLQGQRIISTTGIKCVGNTVVLQGVPYSPPYRIAAVGSPDELYAALLASPEVRTYRDYTAPPYNLGWSLRSRSALTVPGYTGALTLLYARPAPEADTS
jgi:uncharacterized protein YlxW (UPF0749 family)